MNKALDQLTMPLFEKSFDSCTEEELQQLAQQYPWFAPAQLLYAKKLQAGDQAAYEEQVEKTGLYFNNRLWMEKVLREEREEMRDEGREMRDEGRETSIEADSIQAGAFKDEIAPDDSGAGAEFSAEPPLTLPVFQQEPVDVTTALTFEPYHTVDYFASQGIKAKEEDKPADRFSHQLKSFTEWLKTLKRVPPSEIEKTSDPVSERKVEQLAEHSLAERHVITEAMAEVWVKQGNLARAEEIYRKLSLLEPLKSAYFAAKIEEIKKTS